MNITREHCLAVANWIDGIAPLPIAERMKYSQSVIDCETACCAVGALSLVSGLGHAHSRVFIEIVEIEMPALGENYRIAAGLCKGTHQEYGPIIAALLRDDRAEADRRAVATQRPDGSGVWFSGVVRNQTGGESRLYGTAQSHGQTGGVVVLWNDAESHDQTDGTAWLYDTALSHDQIGGTARLLDNAQSHDQIGGVAKLFNVAQSHGQTGGVVLLWDNAQSHNMRGGTLYVRSPRAKAINHLGGTIIWQEWRDGGLVETRREVKPNIKPDITENP